MPMPIPQVARELTHTRRIRYEGYKRADGLWDIEGHLSDIKSHDYELQLGVRRAGQPVHEMWVRITIDDALNIRDAIAGSDAVPYLNTCERIAPAYQCLIGMNLLRDFRRQVKAHLGAVRGCTHMTEMLGGFPTAAIQTLSGERDKTAQSGHKPFQLDQCHALATNGALVKQFYPQWFQPSAEAQDQLQTKDKV